MAYTEEMTTSEILLQLASIRNGLLQAVNDIEKISKNICYKVEQVELRIKTVDYCDICNHERCMNCVADSHDDYCVPSNYEPQIEGENK